MSLMNRLGNSKNPYQGQHKRVLCVCSAGLLRSPTTAVILSQDPYNHNTRAAGVSDEYALVQVDHVLLHWADEIVCMEQHHADIVLDAMKKYDVLNKHVVVLNVPDKYAYMDAELQKLIREAYDKAF